MLVLFYSERRAFIEIKLVNKLYLSIHFFFHPQEKRSVGDF